MNVVIVGGGFAGVRTAIGLARDRKMKVTLISDEPYFLYHATLYSVATGHTASESVVSLGHIFADYPNVTVVRDTITAIDPHRRLVTGSKDYSYDELVLAIGIVTTYFGISGMDQHAYGIKTLSEVSRFKRHIYEEVIEDKLLDKNYIVVGAGPTGVELAGALNEYLQELVKQCKIRRTKVQVTLVEAAPRILPRLSETASKKVTARLRKTGIKVLTSHTVEALSDEDIVIDGRHVPSHTVIWTSGVAQHSFFKSHEELFKLGPGARVVVDEHLQAAPHIYVVGDNASTKFSGVATTALTDAKFITKLLRAKAHKRGLPAYKPVKFPDSLAVDRGWAYVESHKVYASGKFGYHVRRLLELQVLTMTVGLSNALPVWRARALREDIAFDAERVRIDGDDVAALQ